MTVLELGPDGRYDQTGYAQGDASLTVTPPFPVTLVPSALLARDPRRPA